MKKIFFLFFVIPFLVYAQWDFEIAMGLDFKSTPSYRDYINSNFSQFGKKLSSFSSAINFSSEINYKISKNFQLGGELSYLIDSYNAPIGAGGIYEISYTFLRPSLVAYYVVSGTGYKFKFGGGLGPRFIFLTEDNITKIDYSTNGFGLLIKAEGNTLLSDNLYAVIGIDLRFDNSGDLKDKVYQNKIINFYNGQAVNMTSISAGIKLGIAYIF
ncbi:MAG: hypothetical protein QHH13_01145 [Melioribacter sp.]|uniref:hypothetical protein n=1 Tax=Rosettibacter primus TaxID=3111523 RepID=UPI00247C9CEC|nr:hypothetical protein [Melioribacter sp.]